MDIKKRSKLLLGIYILNLCSSICYIIINYKFYLGIISFPLCKTNKLIINQGNCKIKLEFENNETGNLKIYEYRNGKLAYITNTVNKKVEIYDVRKRTIKTFSIPKTTKILLRYPPNPYTYLGSKQYKTNTSDYQAHKLKFWHYTKNKYTSIDPDPEYETLSIFLSILAGVFSLEASIIGKV